MEAQTRSSLRRKPLSDCTNTIATTRRNSSSLAAKSSAIVKPPKPSESTTITTTTTIAKPKPQPQPPTPSSSLKSHTSTGSNNSPITDSVASIPDPPAPPTPLFDSDVRDRRKFGASAAQGPRQDARTRKDKGKMVLENPMDANTRKDKGKMVLENPMDAITRKDMGKMVLETSMDEITRRDKGKMVSETPMDAITRKDKGKMVLETPINEITRKDKGKMVLETPVIEISDALTAHAPQISASGSRYLFGPPAVHDQNLDEQTRKDKGNMFMETPNIKASAASGTCDQQRPGGLTIYNLRKAPETRKCASGKITLPLSCSPVKRTKKKGIRLVDDGGDSRGGSHTDPLPLNKKKRSRSTRDDPIMPLDETEKLRAYYAEIDAFELPEEVASEED